MKQQKLAKEEQKQQQITHWNQTTNSIKKTHQLKEGGRVIVEKTGIWSKCCIPRNQYKQGEMLTHKSTIRYFIFELVCPIFLWGVSDSHWYYCQKLGFGISIYESPLGEGKCHFINMW